MKLPIALDYIEVLAVEPEPPTLEQAAQILVNLRRAGFSNETLMREWEDLEKALENTPKSPPFVHDTDPDGGHC